MAVPLTEHWTQRRFYMEAGVAEYWMVDREEEVVIQVWPDSERGVSTMLTWSPPGARATLEIDVAKIFAGLRGSQGAE